MAGAGSAGYPHRLRVERRSDRGAGTQDPGTGVFTPATAAAVAIFEGEADVQLRPRILERNDDGTPSLTSDADAYLADESLIGQVEEGDVATITWEDDRTDDAQVARIDRLSGVLYLKHV